MIDFEITELHRRLANIIQLGKIVETNYAEVIPKAKVEIGELKTAWLPMLVQRAGSDSSAWLLEINEQVLILSPSGDLAQGIILGSLNQQAFPSVTNESHIHRSQYKDGAVIEYDRKKHVLKAILPSGAKTEIQSDGGIKLTGDVTVIGNIKTEGDIKATGDITDKKRSMKQDRATFNIHKHLGITPGVGSTLVPTEQQ